MEVYNLVVYYKYITTHYPLTVHCKNRIVKITNILVSTLTRI